MTRRPPSSTLFPSTPLSRSLPTVARHVIKPVAVGRETGNRSGSAETIGLSVFIWETALPDVRLPSAVGRLRFAPNVGFAIQATARSIFPFRFGRQSFARPPGVGQCVIPADVHDGMLFTPSNVRAGAFWMTPVCTGSPFPPDGMIVQRHFARRPFEEA